MDTEKSIKNPSHFRRDQTVNHEIMSSKNEENLSGMPSEHGGNLRDKRFFFHFVTTTTLINYSFYSTIITKTVSLINTVFNPGALLICRPDGYAVCPYTSDFFG
jgi:hypothetical protein